MLAKDVQCLKAPSPMAVTDSGIVMFSKDLHSQFSKGTVPNGRHRLRHSDSFPRLATIKGSFPDGRHRLRDSDAHQRRAMVKGIVFPKTHNLKRQRTQTPSQTPAIPESMTEFGFAV